MSLVARKSSSPILFDAFADVSFRMGVQHVMAEMERMQLRGEIPEDELKALELDMTGKIMLASWRGTRFEVMQVLRDVCDKVLKDHTIPDSVLLNRAKVCVTLLLLGASISDTPNSSKALMIIGAIFRQTVPDESAEERRELERMVAEAAAGKSKHTQLQLEARARAKAQAQAQARGQNSAHTQSQTHGSSPKERPSSGVHTIH